MELGKQRCKHWDKGGREECYWEENECWKMAEQEIRQEAHGKQMYPADRILESV